VAVIIINAEMVATVVNANITLKVTAHLEAGSLERSAQNLLCGALGSLSQMLRGKQ